MQARSPEEMMNSFYDSIDFFIEMSDKKHGHVSTKENLEELRSAIDREYSKAIDNSDLVALQFINDVVILIEKVEISENARHTNHQLINEHLKALLEFAERIIIPLPNLSEKIAFYLSYASAFLGGVIGFALGAILGAIFGVVIGLATCVTTLLFAQLFELIIVPVLTLPALMTAAIAILSAMTSLFALGFAIKGATIGAPLFYHACEETILPHANTKRIKEKLIDTFNPYRLNHLIFFPSHTKKENKAEEVKEHQIENLSLGV